MAGNQLVKCIKLHLKKIPTNFNKLKQTIDQEKTFRPIETHHRPKYLRVFRTALFSKLQEKGNQEFQQILRKTIIEL